MNVRARIVIGIVLSLAAAAPADAHVRITPAVLAPGAVHTLTFRCPNEETGTAVSAFVVQMPENAPVGLVSVPRIRGWHATIAHGASATDPTTITWKGGAIEPGAYQDFTIVAGPMPRGVDDVAFKAVQTYANGDVVRWIQVRGPGEEPPEHPAPVLHLH